MSVKALQAVSNSNNDDDDDDDDDDDNHRDGDDKRWSNSGGKILSQPGANYL